MEQLISLVLMGIIGAIIGGLTNYIAIRMLFRPYRPIYIGGWRLPFTPGLIPKRREELARQLGHLVSAHLLTDEVVAARVFDPALKKDLLKRLKEAIRPWLAHNSSVRDLLIRLGGAEQEGMPLLALIENLVNRQVEEGMARLGRRTLDELLPPQTVRSIEGQMISYLSRKVLFQLALFLESEEGEKSLALLLDRFIRERQGWLRLVGSLLFSERRIVQLAQHELGRFLRNPMVAENLTAVLLKEWERIKAQPLATLWSAWERELYPLIQHALHQEIDHFLDCPLNQLLAGNLSGLLERALEGAVIQLEKWLKPRIGKILEQLNLEEVVFNRVQSFPLERVEALAVAVARRELRMITFLGAGLGGIIGLVQGAVVLFLL